PLLGSRPGERFGQRRQRRPLSGWIAQGQFAIARLSTSFFRKTVRVAIAVFCAWMVTVPVQTAAPLKLKQTIALPGVEGRIDHFAFDAAGQRLFVCALGNDTVEVLDVRKGERIHSITGLGAPQGIAYLPELNRV